jgi:type II secretory pathway component GspD/PulD (secretin)
MTYAGLLTDPMFQAVIHALEKTGNARTLSVPKVTTVNNKTASIRVGDDFRYYDEYSIQSIPSQVTGNSGNTVYTSQLVPVGSPKLEELGIELKVRPSVGADMSSVTLQLLPEISEFVRYETFEVGTGGNNGQNSTSATNGMSTVKLPIFRRSKIETEVIVQSGETVVMGGLITSTESKHKDKIPFLASIPFIGLLFQNDLTDNDQKNLLIFVTATIISERGENLIPLASAQTEVPPAAKANGVN